MNKRTKIKQNKKSYTQQSHTRQKPKCITAIGTNSAVNHHAITLYIFVCQTMYTGTNIHTHTDVQVVYRLEYGVTSVVLYI